MFSSQAANYLDIKGLLDVTCKTVANNIKGKTMGEIQRMFSIKNDYTPQEQKTSTTTMETHSAASRKRKLAASTSSTSTETATTMETTTEAMGVLPRSRAFNEFPDGDLYSIFKCMLAVTNDLAVLYALAQV